MYKTVPLYWTKMYPMALMFLAPLSDPWSFMALFPHVLESSPYSPVPKPILESQLLESFCFPGYQFLLWKSLYRWRRRWSLPCYNWSAGTPENQSASSMCYDPVRWRGICRQQSVRTESWPASWWQGTCSHGRSSYRGRSWRRVCSSRSATWSLERQTQSCLLTGCRLSCCSKSQNCNERFSEIQTRMS